MPKINGHSLLNYYPISYEGGVIKPCDAPGFRYRGGKWGLRRQIVRHCAMAGKAFAEPYAGRGNVTLLMRTLASFQEWHLNDLQTVDFLTAIKEYSGREIPMITHYDIGGPRGYSTRGWNKHPDQEAILLLEPVLFWSGGRRGQSTPSNNSYIPERYRDGLLKARAILEGVNIHKTRACDFIEEYGKDEDNFLYVDPPYLKVNVGVYRDHKEERRRMIEVLTNAKCRWLLSEYRCQDLDRAFGPPKSVIISIADTGSTHQKKRETVECLYANYNAKPVFVDFGDTPIVLPTSKTILIKAGGLISYDQWYTACTIEHPMWDDKKREEQFKALCKQPWCYYNGRELQLLEE